MQDHTKYKWFLTSTKSLVIGGKSSSQNDSLIRDLKEQKIDYVMMHTAAPGSPFSCIIKEPSSVTEEEKKECAIFTACFSRAWKNNAKNVKIHVFNLSQLYKMKSMAVGTWGVKGKVKEIIVNDLVLEVKRQNKVLRAIPLTSGRKKKVLLMPGKIDKQDILAKLEIELNEPLSKEEVLSALPAGGISIKAK